MNTPRKIAFIPPLIDVINVLRENPKLMLKESNNYSADKLMMLLDNEKLGALEDEFREHPDGIELPNYIWLMKCAIPHPNEDRYELVNGLVKLFQDIDINGDGHMEWSEFTQYIIDAVIEENKGNDGEGNPKLNKGRFELGRDLNENEILDKAYSRKQKRYMNSKLFDSTPHTNVIKKMMYNSNTDQILLLEQGTKKIKYYSMQCTVDETLHIEIKERFDKTFVLDFFFEQSLGIIGVVLSNRQIHFYESGFNHKMVLNYESDILQTNIWYLPEHLVWVSSGVDYNLRFWKLKDGRLDLTQTFSAHMKEITCALDIHAPKLVASSSLDGRIKLWDYFDRTLINELKDPSFSNRGVKGLCYSYEFGGLLLSFGFENYINVWCPEVSLSRPHVGKLEGHSSIVIHCKFLTGSPNAISIDEKSNIRIWDVRSMVSIQVLAAEKGASIINDFTVIPKYDRFVTGGKRLSYFDNLAESKNLKSVSDDICPLSVDFNSYYNVIVVQTKMDMRLYDALTGKLKKVLNDLNDEKFVVDLTYFCFGVRQRKFFIGDNAGFIRVYNMKNGEFMKKVNQLSDLETGEFANKGEHIKRKELNEISQIIYISEEKLLITASWDSTIRIYDESEPEESILLKVLSGGHQNSEIMTLAFTGDFSLLATGSSNGLITLWDFETGKVEAVLLGHTGEINCLSFAEPYPIVVSGSQDGSLMVWGIRPCPNEYRYRCIFKLYNRYDVNTKLQVFPVNAIIMETSFLRGVGRNTYSNLSIEKLEDLFFEEVRLNSHDQVEVKIVENTETKIADRFNLDSQSYDMDANIVKRRCLIYYGDSNGQMHLLDISGVLSIRKINETERINKKQNYQLHRKDLINASKQVENFIQMEKMNPGKFLCFYSTHKLTIRRWDAHSGSIISLQKIADPLSYSSCSLDKCAKFWSPEGISYGCLNLSNFTKNTWNFPFDWVKQKLDDIDFVFESLKLIEKEELSERQKENIKSKYLIKKFLWEDFNKYFLEKDSDLYTNHKAKTNLKNLEKYAVHIDVSKALTRLEKHDEDELLFRANFRLDENEKKTIVLKDTLQTDNLKGLPLKLYTAMENFDCKGTFFSQPIIESMKRIGGINNLTTIKTNDGKYLSRNSLNLVIPSGTVSIYNKPNTSQVRNRSDIMEQNRPTKSSQNQRSKKLFANFSSSSLAKNSINIQNLLNSKKKIFKQLESEVPDMKYRIGEHSRALKLSTLKQESKFDSNSQNLVCNDNEVLQRRKKYYKDMQGAAKILFGSDEANNEEENHKRKQSSHHEKTFQVIASKNFLHNPYKNKHKIVKAKSKIFVL